MERLQNIVALFQGAKGKAKRITLAGVDLILVDGAAIDVYRKVKHRPRVLAAVIQKPDGAVMWCRSPALSPVLAEADKQFLRDMNVNPEMFMIAHGRVTGVCCLCGRKLTDPASVERGMGASCAARWSLPC